MADPFGRAIADQYHSQQTDPLFERYGNEVNDHRPFESIYFSDFTTEGEDDRWVASWLEGPLLDIGAGAGRHALYFQDQFETVAIEISEHLVETMRERGVTDTRHIDMFEIRREFERDRFRSVLAIGTQFGLTKSTQGLRRFLNDLDFVTTPDATAVFDSYYPEKAVEHGVPGFHSDETRGFAYRIVQFEYEGEISDPLLFQFFSPARLKEAVVGTGWKVSETRCHPSDRESPVQYRAALEKV